MSSFLQQELGLHTTCIRGFLANGGASLSSTPTNIIASAKKYLIIPLAILKGKAERERETGPSFNPWHRAICLYNTPTSQFSGLVLLDL